MKDGGAAACWSLCLPSPRDDDHDIELNEVSVKDSGNDSTSEDATPEPMPRAKPTWRTRQLFDPQKHLKLDAMGLHPDHMAIYDSEQSADEIARLLNCAQEFVNSRPLVCPPGFDAATHAQQQADGSWVPRLAGIRGDNQLTEPQKIDVFRWARIYRPGTRTDPVHVKRTAAYAAGIVGIVVVMFGAIGGGVAYAASLARGASPIPHAECEHQLMNETATEALLESLREQFSPQLDNATLENWNVWYPTIRANLSEPIYRDVDGNFIEYMCRSAAEMLESAARTLDPMRSMLVVLSLLALQMLLQG